MRRVLTLLLLAACADVRHAVHIGEGGRISWQLRVSPTDASGWPAPPGALAAAVAPAGQDRVRAWVETGESQRSWLVIHASAPDVSAWARLRGDLLGRAPAPTPAWLHPPDVKGNPPVLAFQVPAGSPGGSPGTWSLSAEGFSSQEADSRPIGHGAYWERPLATLARDGIALTASSERPRATLPGGAPLAALGAGAAGLWLVGRLVRRQATALRRPARLRR